MKTIIKKASWRWSLVVLVLIGSAACDSASVDDEADDILDQEIAASVAFISDDLSFTATESALLESAFVESDAHAHEAGFLWRVAARLQEKMDEQQRERLMARLENHGAVFGAPGFHFGLEPGFGQRFMNRRGFGPFGGFAAAGAFADHLGLTDQQKDDIKVILSDTKVAMEDLRDQHANGFLTDEQFQDALRELMDDTKVAWEALLTTDQKAILDQMKADREDARQERELQREQDKLAARAVMIDVLGLTDDQLLLLDALQLRVDDFRIAFQELIDGGATREDVKEWAEGARGDISAELVAIFDQTQLEIFLIHGVLHSHAGERFRQMRQNGPMGNRGPMG